MFTKDNSTYAPVQPLLPCIGKKKKKTQNVKIQKTCSSLSPPTPVKDENVLINNGDRGVHPTFSSMNLCFDSDPKKKED